jgi:replicative DNA helicase
MYSNIKAEIAFLNLIIKQESWLVKYIDTVSGDFFADPSNRLVFDAVKKLFAVGSPINEISLGDRLPKNIKLSDYFVETKHDPETLYSSLKTNHSKRLLFALSSNIDTGLKAGYDVDQIVGDTNKTVLRITNDIESTDTGFAGVMAEALAASLINANTRSSGGVIGIDLINNEINALTGGARRKELVILAARPGVGKSYYSCKILSYNALVLNKTGLLVSLEMNRELVGQRIMAQTLGVRLDSLSNGFVNKTELQSIFEPIRCLSCGGTDISQAVDHKEYIVVNTCLTCGSDKIYTKYNYLADCPNIFVDDRAGLSLDQIITTIKMHKIQHPELEFFIIDHLHEIGYIPGTSPNEKMKIACGAFRNLAKQLDLAAIVVSQLSRKVEESDNKRPQLHHLRDSGGIEEKGDVVLFLYRPAYYDDSKDHREIEFIIAKNRNGPKGVAIGICDLPHQNIERGKYTP